MKKGVKNMNRSEEIYNAYDTIIIFQPALSKDEYTHIKLHYLDLLNRLECSKIKHDIIGNKKLAYKVQDYEQGYYIQFSYIATPDAVASLEQNLREDDDAIKFISVLTESDVEAPDTNPESEQNNKNIDAMDVLLGLAKYNQKGGEYDS